MRKYLIGLVAVLMAVAFSTTTWAVEKKEKKTEVKKVQVSDPSKKATTGAASGQNPKKKKYDDFVDLNKNGIDDRCESRKLQKEKAAQEKAANPPVKAAVETKKPANPEAKKEEPKEKKPK